MFPILFLVCTDGVLNIQRCTNYGDCKPFPTNRVGVERVGSVMIDGKIRKCDADILISKLHLE